MKRTSKLLASLLLVVCINQLASQAQELNVTFASEFNDAPIKTDSIYVINLNHPDTVILRYPDTVLILGDKSTGITDVQTGITPGAAVYPNPFRDECQLTVHSGEAGITRIKAYDLSGKLVANYSKRLEAGLHNFNFSAKERGLYMLNVQTPDHSETLKVIKQSESAAEDALALINSTNSTKLLSLAKVEADTFYFAPGDSLVCKAYLTSGRYFNETKVITPTSSMTCTFDTAWYYWNDAQGGLDALYRSFIFDGAYKRGYQMMMALRSDEFSSSSPDLAWPYLAAFNAQYELTSWPWRDFFGGILRAHEILAYYPKMDMDDALRTRMMGEAYFVRGLCYFHLLNVYKEVPIYTELATSKADYQIAKSSRSDVYAQAISDFETAMSLLPLKSAYALADSKNATKAAAAGFLAKTYVYTEQWDKAKTVLKDIIDGEYDSYSLVADYSDNCNSAGEGNVESLFEIHFSFDGTNDHSWVPSYGHEDNYSSTRTVASYIPTDLNGWHDMYVNDWLHEAFLQDSTLDEQRDPRLDASYYHSANYDYTTDNFKTINDDDSLVIRKYVFDGEISYLFGDINQRLLRYADILLLYAETLNELGQGDEGIPYINQVRQRANLESYAGSYTQDEIRDLIANERLLEFSFEGQRYLDILRWGWLSDSDKLNELKARDSDFEGYEAGKEYLPIYDSYLQDNPQLIQDPGWAK